MSPNVIAQIRQIQAKLRERTIGSKEPADKVNNPVWDNLCQQTSLNRTAAIKFAVAGASAERG